MASSSPPPSVFLFENEWNRWFWDEDVWLPPNVSWVDMQSTEKAKYYNFYHLWYPIPAAILLIGLRAVLEK